MINDEVTSGEPQERPFHFWPGDGEHLWGPWMTRTGLPKPTQYRQCVHPQCSEVDTREAPKA